MLAPVPAHYGSIRMSRAGENAIHYLGSLCVGKIDRTRRNSAGDQGMNLPHWREVGIFHAMKTMLTELGEK